MRRVLAALAIMAGTFVSQAPPSVADAPASGCGESVFDGTPVANSPLDAHNRANRFVPKPAGIEERYCVFYGPYVIPGGHDLSRVDFDLALDNGFVVAGGPSVVYADGSEPSHQEMHIHHSHWWFVDPNDGDRYPLPWMRWISGSGEEQTRGDFREIAAADPDGPRFGLFVGRGDRVAMINMLHNKTSSPKVVWIKVDLAFVHGSAEEISQAGGADYHALTGVLIGDTFDAERGFGGADGKYVYPLELDADGSHDSYDSKVIPGVGQVWTAPFNGTIVIGAAHVHPGGERVVVTNLGSEANACPNDRADGIWGTTLYELDVLNRTPQARFSEDFQIEITQAAFRAPVHAGDRIAVNGIYDTSEHGWFDAMSHSGFYVDTQAPPGSETRCAPYRADGTPGAPIDGRPNRPWEGEPDTVCFTGCDDPQATIPDDGPPVDRILIANFLSLPGNQSAASWTPVYQRGATVEFVNADMGQYVRHTVTSCPAPCNGDYIANYPLPDGDFDSGYLGWEPTTGGKQDPRWTLDTADLEPGLYTYFCRVHPWMRGALRVS